MQIEFLILADSVQVADGKLFVLGGGFSVWRSGVFPAPALLGIGGVISVTMNEVGTAYPLNITIADEGGVPIVPPLQAQFQVSAIPDLPKDAPLRLPFAFNAGIPIPRIGRYFINALAGGSARKQTSFDAIFVGKKIDLAPSGSPTERGN